MMMRRHFLFALAGIVAASLAINTPAIAIAGETEWLRLTKDGHFKQRPNWSPDGSQLLFTRHKGATLRLITRTIATSEEHRVTEKEETEADGVWSPDGKEIALTFNKPQPNQSNVEVYRYILAEQRFLPVAEDVKGLSHEEYPCWSPDGARLAYSSTHQGNQEIYTAKIDGSDVIRLTSDPAQDAHPAWSPSGEEIVFATDRWGDLEIAAIRPDGSQTRRLTFSRGLDDFPAWSPDGKRLAFCSSRDGNREIYLLDLESGEQTRRTFNRGVDDYPAWSPDGRLTFVSQRDGGFDVYMEPAP